MTTLAIGTLHLEMFDGKIRERFDTSSLIQNFSFSFLLASKQLANICNKKEPGRGRNEKSLSILLLKSQLSNSNGSKTKIMFHGGWYAGEKDAVGKMETSLG